MSHFDASSLGSAFQGEFGTCPIKIRILCDAMARDLQSLAHGKVEQQTLILDGPHLEIPRLE
jgi:hypothetical protein